MEAKKSFSVLFSFLAIATTLGASTSFAQDQLIVTPRDAHQPFLMAIDGAKSKVDMVMFHISDQDAIKALKDAQTRGVQVRVILDGVIASKSKTAPAIIADMQSAGVTVHMSSPAFTITHEKSMLVDDKSLFITSINLTTIASRTRDFGIVTANAADIAEFKKFFETDLQNALTGAGLTPTNATRLVWSPDTSLKQIIDFIGSAKKSVLAEVENLGSLEIQAALIQAAKAGVEVKLTVPMCILGDSPNRNEPYLDELIQGGVSVRVMGTPSTALKPYIHAKTIVIDDQKFFVGSENFSFNSLTKAREVGIISSELPIASDIATVLKSDFGVAEVRTLGKAAVCN